MREMKPIPFNTEMVQAILEGRKTVTRRKAKFEQRKEFPNINLYASACVVDAYGYSGDTHCIYQKIGNCWNEMTYPLKAKYVIGDILYVQGAERIFLFVTDVKLERLQDIRYYEVYQEGINSADICTSKCNVKKLCVEIESEGKCHVINAFKKLWNSTVRKDERLLYSWNANPYVFVYEFKRITKEEAMKESEE